MELHRWLESLGLADYTQLFLANDVDATLLPSLTSDDLREIGITSVGHRRRLLDAIASLNAPAGDTSALSATNFVPPMLPKAANTISGNRSQQPWALQRRQITVLFCDLVGSTALSTRVDPEELREFLDSYRAAVAAEIQEHNGWIAQYLGDGVMAYFGYPQASEHACVQAVRAALRIVSLVSGLRTIGGQQPQVRIGIATGLTVIGKRSARSAGEEDAEFSAVGEAPNLAARAQSEAKPNSVVITASTREHLGELFHYSDVGLFDLTGCKQQIKLWQVLGESKSSSRFSALHGGHPRVRLMGRDSEVKCLESRLAAAAAGRGQLLVITGESGLGKSRLVEHLFESLGRNVVGASAPERLVLQCSPYNFASALHPVRDYIERDAGVVPEDTPEAVQTKIASLLGRAEILDSEHLTLVAELLRVERDPTSPLHGVGSLEVRERTMCVLCNLLAAAAKRCSLFVVEDMQWIDPSTLELLGNFMPLLRRLPVLLVATSRSAPRASWLKGPHVGLVQLDRLDAVHTRQLVIARAAPQELPERVLDTIVLRSDGVPLFVEELTRGYLHPSVTQAPSTQRNATEEIGNVAIPTTLAESILAQLDRVPHGRDIAPAAAVLGRQVPIAMLIAISAFAEADVRRCVADLLEAGVFVPGRSPIGETVAFRHRLVQEAAYQLLLLRDRVRLHGLVVATMESRYPDIAATVPHIMAVHFAEAGEPSRAVTHWQLAAADADRRSAYSEALAYYRRALCLTRTMPPDRARDQLEFDLILNMIGPLVAVQGLAAIEREHEVERVSELSLKLGTRTRLMPALALKVVMLGVAGNWPAGYALAHQMSALAEGGIELDRLIAHRYLGTTLIFMGKFRQAVEETLRFLALYDHERHGEQLSQLKPANHTAMMMVGLVECYVILGEMAPAQHWCERALLAARAEGSAHALAQTLAFACCFPAALMGHGEALSLHARELKRLTDSHELPQWQGHTELFCGITLMKQGWVEQGLELARCGVHQLVINKAFSNVWYILYCQACEAVGALEDAWRGLELAAPTIAFGHSWLDAEYLRMRGRLKLSKGDRGAAMQDFGAALTLAAEQGATLFIKRARQDFEMLARC